MNKNLKKKLLLIIAFVIVLVLYANALRAQEAAQPAPQPQSPVQTEAPAESEEQVHTLPQNQAPDPQQEPQKPQAPPEEAPAEEKKDDTAYYFRNDKLLTQHFEKHGIEMGFESKESYEEAASDVVNNPAALHKIEKEDGDTCYYVEDTNEFVVLSKDGYLRTYFLPSAGKKYYDKQ